MREANLVDQLEVVAPSDAERGRCPLADAIECQNGRLLERRAEESRRGVRLVVFGEEHLAPKVDLLADDARYPELFLEPDRHRLGEGGQGARKGRQVGEENSLELHERFVVEDHVVEIAHLQSGLFEAVLGRVTRKPGIVFLARESLFVASGHQLAVAEQCGRRVVVEARDSENVHGGLAPRVRCTGRWAFVIRLFGSFLERSLVSAALNAVPGSPSPDLFRNSRRASDAPIPIGPNTRA